MKKLFIIFLALIITQGCTSKKEKSQELCKTALRKMYALQKEEAMQDFTKAIELDPQNEAAYYYRGNLKYSLQDYQGALADYSKAIEINPNFADAYSNRGLLYESLNERDKACADWKKAQELGKVNLRDKLRMCM